MSEILPNYTWDEIRKLSYDELGELPCCEIVDGDSHRVYGIFLMVPSNEFIKATADDRGQLSNTVIPQPFKTPKDFIKEPDSTVLNIDAGLETSVNTNIEINPLACQYCGKPCANKAGKSAHERNCDKNPDKR